MTFVNRFGKNCRYKFGDKIIDQCDYPNQPVYTVINAEWIGNSNGFWEIFLEDGQGNKYSKFGSNQLKKVGSIYA